MYLLFVLNIIICMHFKTNSKREDGKLFGVFLLSIIHLNTF